MTQTLPDTDLVAEVIEDERLGFEARLDNALITGVARTQHHPVLAKGHRP